MKILANSKFTVIRKLSAEDVRQLCIQKNYYTCGDCQAYEGMLEYVRTRDHFTDADLLAITNNIYEHSDVEKFKEEYGCSDGEVFSAIFFEVARTSHMHVEVK